MKKILCILLAMCLTLTLSPYTAIAAPAVDKSWYSDSKSEFILTTEAQLLGMAELANDPYNPAKGFQGKTIKLGGDITVTQAWDPMFDNEGFLGTFDGNGKRIHLKGGFLSKYNSTVGLFERLWDGAAVKNVTVVIYSKNEKPTSYWSGGFIAESAHVESGQTKGIIISNCHVEGSASGTSFDFGDNSGAGLVGSASGVKLEKCSVKLNISADYSVSGITGGMTSGTITDCSFSGTLISRTDGAAGITMYAGDSPTGNTSVVISRCKVNGKLYGFGKNSGSSAVYVGGIAAKTFGANPASKIIDCTVNADITITGDNGVATVAAGGIAGDMQMPIENCVAEGSITVNVMPRRCYIGGIAGLNKLGAGQVRKTLPAINNCKYYGNITGKGTEESFVGGIVGNIINLAVSSASGISTGVMDCTFSGNVNGNERIGGIAGNVERVNIEHCSVSGNITAQGEIADKDVLVGGVIGYAEYMNLSKCSVSATVGGSARGTIMAGGLIGHFYSETGKSQYKIEESYFNGSISTPGSVNVNGTQYAKFLGGLTGLFKGTVSINNCYASGSVNTGEKPGAAKGDGYGATYFASGLLNIMLPYVSEPSEIKNCYVAMTFPDYDSDAGLYLYHPMAVQEGKVSISGCFVDNVLTKSRAYTSNDGQEITELPTTQMGFSSTYRNAGWDDSIWSLDQGSYPKLKNAMTLPASKPVNLDSASTWARDGITSALSKGFVPSDVQNNYTNVITRQEFCRMAIKWLEYATGKSIDMVLSEKGLSRNTNAFSDTSDPDILAAYALGITSGTSAPTATTPGKFTPNGQFSREQAATMVMNTCKAFGANVNNPPASGFTDLNTASSWAVNGINFCYAHKIMQGTSATPLIFSPTATYTREQSILTFNNIHPAGLPKS